MKLDTGHKISMFVISALLSFNPSLSLGRSADPSIVYRSEPIVLKNMPGFGEATDWKAQFYNTFTDICVAPDGSIFAASSRQHTIFKFDSTGSFIKSFGQEGQGPGDFNNPSKLSILDKKYLVVGEYALGHRISLFDLDGNFVKLLKTDQSVYYPTAIKEGKVAYIGITHSKLDKQQTVQTQTVFIKDVQTQEEIKLHTFKTPSRSIELKMGGAVTFDDNGGWIYLGQTHEGNLAVGVSTESIVTVYGPDGSKLYEFSLKGDPVLVTKEMIRRYKEIGLNQIRQDPNFQKSYWKESIKELEKASFDHLFDDYLPRYNEMLVDEEGNFLFFRTEGCFVDCPIKIDVYNSHGDFICKTEIKTADYHLIVDKRREHMCFTKSGLVALVQPKIDLERDEFHLKMIKVIF
jgi:hypothetical protein